MGRIHAEHTISTTVLGSMHACGIILFKHDINYSDHIQTLLSHEMKHIRTMGRVVYIYAWIMDNMHG